VKDNDVSPGPLSTTPEILNDPANAVLVTDVYSKNALAAVCLVSVAGLVPSLATIVSAFNVLI
jgi:hypothetical protein